MENETRIIRLLKQILAKMDELARAAEDKGRKKVRAGYRGSIRIEYTLSILQKSYS